MFESDRKYRVLYPDGNITRPLTRAEALPLFNLYGEQLLEIRATNQERRQERLYKERIARIGY